MDTKKRLIYLIIGPVLFAIASVALKGALGGPGAMAIGTLLWMVFWWATQPVSLTVTAFLPVGINALFGMVEQSGVIAQYASGSIILIFGSCLLTIPWASQGAEQEPGFYLAHDLWGQPSQVGCPYLDWRCSVADTHALIYGHRVGTTDLQFSPIANAWDQGVFDALGAATLETRTDTKSYVPCFALKVDKSYEQIQRFSMNRDELRSWLEDMLGEASAASPRAQDLCRHATKALTLATCASSQAGQRERTLLVFVGTSA